MRHSSATCSAVSAIASVPYACCIFGLMNRQPSVVSSSFRPRANAASALPIDVRRPRHALDPAGDDERHLAAADRARPLHDGVEARPAQPVDRRSRHLFGQPGEQQRHAADVAVVFARLIRTPVDHVVDARDVEAGISFAERRDGDAARSSVRTLGERARRTGRTACGRRRRCRRCAWVGSDYRNRGSGIRDQAAGSSGLKAHRAQSKIFEQVVEGFARAKSLEPRAVSHRPLRQHILLVLLDLSRATRSPTGTFFVSQ